MEKNINRNKLKLILPILLVLVSSFLFATAVLALDTGLGYGTYSGLGMQDLRVSIMNVVRYVLGFLGILAIVIILYGGFVWMTAAGNEEKISKAKKILINAVIGLVIILTAFMITSFVINQLIIATGAGGGPVCTPDSCVGCKVKCSSDGNGYIYTTTAGECDSAAYCGADGEACPRPATVEPTICKIEATRGYAVGGVPQGASGDYVTVEGWYFGDYDAGTSVVNFDATAANIVQCSGVPVWYQRANDYGYTRVEVPALNPATYQVALTNADNQTSAFAPFAVISVANALPGLACIVPPSGVNNQTLEKAEGIRFGADPGAAGGLFFQINQKANYSSWSDTLISQPVVPALAVSGKVHVTDASGAAGNNVWFTVTCQNNSDCASQCCKSFMCQPAAACLPGPGESCDPDSATPACEPDGQCQPGLTCDATKCQCRLPGPGENCDLTEDPVCEPGNCADDLVCFADLANCTCQEFPIIYWVSPGDGAVGNMITIGGRYFGNTAGDFYFADAAGEPTIEADLASVANENCTDVWTDTEIIVVVPSGAQDGPVKVTTAGASSDQTNDNHGPNIVNFDVNNETRPGLCSIAPITGKPDTPVVLEGISFVVGASEVYFSQVKAEGIVQVDSGLNTITGVTVPAMNPAAVGVRVKVAEEFSNPKTFTVEPATGPTTYECSDQPNSCRQSQIMCNPDEYCNSECRCEDRIACDNGNFATPDICDPNQDLCPAGWFCYNQAPDSHYTLDLNKSPCYCYQALSCDNPTSPASATNSACHPDDSRCPDNYFCDSGSNCTCQPQTGLGTESTYNWSFTTGLQPGACSTDGGLCIPDDTRCAINEICNPTTCVCEKSTVYACDGDANTPVCEPDSDMCAIGKFCNDFCQCENLIPCDLDEATLDCEPGPCPAGYYCYNPAVHGEDPNKFSCYCYPGIPCDGDTTTPTCDEDDDICPDDYSCNDNTCLCEPAVGVSTESTYTWLFTTNTFGPRVVEMCNRNSSCSPDTISSPTPFSRLGTNQAGYIVSAIRPDDGTVPIDAIIGGRFTQRMYVPSLTGNIKLQDCGVVSSDPSNLFNKSNCSTVEVPSSLVVFGCNYQDPVNFDAHCFKLLPNSLLNTNHWYQVVLKAGSIFGENGMRLAANELVSGDYRWVFKTRPQSALSQVACLMVEPTGAGLDEYDKRQRYGAWPIPEDFWCVDIRQDSCNDGYNWSNADPSPPDATRRADIVPTADHPESTCVKGRIGYHCLTDAACNTRSDATDGKCFDSADDAPRDGFANAAAHAETLNDDPNYTYIKAICNFSPPPASSVEGTSNLTIDFSSPRVIDRFPDCGTACLNAKIGATFSKKMDDKNDTHSCIDGGVSCEVEDNIKLYICYDNPDCEVTPTNEVTDFATRVILDPAENPNTYTGDVQCYDFNGDGKNDYCLLPNTYYRVVIDGRVRSANELRSLVGLNFDQDGDDDKDSYSWVFKTQKDYGICLPAQINVYPSEKQAHHNELINYSARAKTGRDICDPEFGQRLSPYSWSWGWDTDRESGRFTPFCTGKAIADFLSLPENYFCDDRDHRLRDSCGNNFVEAGEDCDDGNLSASDGCSATCLKEGSNPSYLPEGSGSTCGDKVIGLGEECEKAMINDVWPAYCSQTNCLWTGNASYDLEVCGNRLIEASEQCDPPGPGCTDNCLYSGSVLGRSLCGDGQIDLGEECDNGELEAGTSPLDGDGCNTHCLIEDTSLGFCRSNINNSFDFSVGSCTGSCESGYSCVPLNTALGNSVTNGSICSNGLVEAGEECDTGGWCKDESGSPVLDAAGRPKYCNASGSFCNAGQTCRPYEGYCNSGTSVTNKPCNTNDDCAAPYGGVCWRDGCSTSCVHNGSVQEVLDPPSVGAYQIASTFDLDGETWIQAWLASYTPATGGPQGQGHLQVGLGEVPGGFNIIDRWPDCVWACRDAAIGAQFNQSADANTIKPSNIFLYECGADSACNLTGLLPISDIAVYIANGEGDDPNDRFDIYLPITYFPVDNDNDPRTPVVPALLPDTYYRVVVRKSVTSAEGQALSNVNYDDPDPTFNSTAGLDSHSWVFKTRPETDFCGLDRVEVIDSEVTLKEGQERYRYFSEPWSEADQCSANGQRLNPYYFDWRWDDVELEAEDNINAANFLIYGGYLAVAANPPYLGLTPPTNGDGLFDGCGNGLVERGEECDGLWPTPGCDSATCLWTGTTPPTCGNNQIDAGEECDPAGGYCASNCLLAGNSLAGDICGNGIIETSEECDTGTEPNGNDADGCTDICTYSGSVAGVPAVCGDGQIGLGEECDDHDLAQGRQPTSGDGCTGSYLDSTAPATRADCEQVDLADPINNHLAWCRWTGNACQTRPCLLEYRGYQVCRSNTTNPNTNNQFDFNQGLNPTSCDSGYSLAALSLATGNNNWALPFCGNKKVEAGEECDDGNHSEGYCSVDASTCSNVDEICSASGTCDGDNSCVISNSIKYTSTTCAAAGTPCTISGRCISDGCGSTCLHNGSAAADGRKDPYQIVESVEELSDNSGVRLLLDQVKEEIQAWHDLQPDRVGVGELTVESSSEIPFVVIGHQPAVDAADQCRNVAIWAVFSKELDLASVGSCQNTYVCATNPLISCDPDVPQACNNNPSVCNVRKSCLSNSGCNPGDSCQLAFKLCQTDCTNPNLIKSFSYQPTQGQCISNQCVFASADLDNQPLEGSTCQVSEECRGSRLMVTSVNTVSGFLDADKNYQIDVEYIKEATGRCYSGETLIEGTICSENSQCGTGNVCQHNSLTCNDSNFSCVWQFSTDDSFCECDYVGVTIDPTSGGTETVADIFTCARDKCGMDTETILDDDAAPASEENLPGNQHLYEAMCYDIRNPQNSRIPIGLGVKYNWSEIDPDNLVYLTAKPLISVDNGSNSYATPGEDKDDEGNPITPVPKGKNGESEAVVMADQYHKSTAPAEFCVPGTANCVPQPASSQNIAITNFICDNPWPDIVNFPYREPDTNFEMYYCRDFGGELPTDDLPALSLTPIVLGFPKVPVKELIFPVEGASSNDAIGIKVLKNPLHLSPATWYKYGLCGGQDQKNNQPAPENLCLTDANCSKNNLLFNPGFEESGGWKFEYASICRDVAAGCNESVPSSWPSGCGDCQSSQGNLTIPSGSSKRTGNSGARLEASDIKNWGLQLTNNSDYSLPAGSYSFSVYVKSDKRVSIGAQLRGGSWTPLCSNANCDFSGETGLVCNNKTGDWEKLNCNFSLTAPRNVQFIVRLAEVSSTDIDDLNLSARCQFNVPLKGSAQETNVDGYQAIRDGRSVYVGATNLTLLNPLWSNIYLISYNQNANAASEEIFNRILDPTKQNGVWYFNTNLTNHRICNNYGYYQGTTTACTDIGRASFNCRASYYCDSSGNNEIDQDEVTICLPSNATVVCSGKPCLPNTKEICEAKASTKGCYWSSELNGCLARVCEPIYCHNDFDCPDLSCNANKEKLVRDAKRFGDLRNTQINLNNFSRANAGYPTLASGTYLAGTSFSVWPSWQQTLANSLGVALPVDPLNRFKGCPGYYCDVNSNGQRDTGDNTVCNAAVDLVSCPVGQCLVVKPDEASTCWNPIDLDFSCPNNMFVYAYHSSGDQSNYELYTNFEYEGSGSWRQRTGHKYCDTNGNGVIDSSETIICDVTLCTAGTCRDDLLYYSLPPACQKLNFEINSALTSGGNLPVDCTKEEGGDLDADGICDNDDNCDPRENCSNPADCYNPNQQNSNFPFDNLGNICDSNCSGDADNDGWCDEYDNCRTVRNCTAVSSDALGRQTCTSGGTDSDGDRIGNTCDPCTDVDADGWWDINTGANDANICPKDNCPTGSFFSSDRRKYCLSVAGVPRAKVCQSVGDCDAAASESCGQPTGIYASYNPFQEDYDNDGKGYICDFCLDFDNDKFGDYSFYTKSFIKVSDVTLIPSQQQHFQGCEGGTAGNLDNCPGGPYGPVCKDQFGITISCSNPKQALWKDIAGLEHTNSQVDYDQDGFGSVCDAKGDLLNPVNCGDGKIDSSRGEVCDCGDGRQASINKKFTTWDAMLNGGRGGFTPNTLGDLTTLSNYPSGLGEITAVYHPINTSGEINTRLVMLDVNKKLATWDATLNDGRGGFVSSTLGDLTTLSNYPSDLGEIVAVYHQINTSGEISTQLVILSDSWCQTLNNKSCTPEYGGSCKWCDSCTNIKTENSSAECNDNEYTAGAEVCDLVYDVAVGPSPLLYSCGAPTDCQVGTYCGDCILQSGGSPTPPATGVPQEECDYGRANGGGACTDECQWACTASNYQTFAPTLVNSSFTADGSTTFQTVPACRISENKMAAHLTVTTTADPTIAVVFISDLSTSLTADDITQLKSGLHTSIANLFTAFGANLKIGLVSFHGSVSLDSGLTTNQAALDGLVDGYSTAGHSGTNFSDAINEAAGLLPSGVADYRIVVFMSDGDPNQPEICRGGVFSNCDNTSCNANETCNDVFNLFGCKGVYCIPNGVDAATAAKNSGIKVYSAAFGAAANTDLLNSISSNTEDPAYTCTPGDNHYCYNSPTDLSDLYVNITDKIRESIGVSFAVTVDGGAVTSFNYGFTDIGIEHTADINLPANFCDNPAHTFAISGLTSGGTVSFSSLGFDYCPAPISPAVCVPLVTPGGVASVAYESVLEVKQSSLLSRLLSFFHQLLPFLSPANKTSPTVEVALATTPAIEQESKGVVAGVFTDDFCCAPTGRPYYCDDLDGDGYKSDISSGSCGSTGTSFPACIPSESGCQENKGDDCDDANINIKPVAGLEAGHCDDTFDNDCDNHIDCDDTDCVCLELENCTDSIDNDGNGYIDCADSDCKGKFGPAGYNCCWDGSYDPDADSNAYCGTCQRCRTPVDLGFPAGSNNYQCRDVVSNDGVDCIGSCTSCTSGGACSPRPNGDPTECAGQVCQDGSCTAVANNPLPSISSINPTAGSANGPIFTLTVTGNDFIPSSVIRWNGSDRTPTNYDSPTRLSVMIPATDIAAAGVVPITVFNPLPGGGLSNFLNFTISADSCSDTDSSQTNWTQLGTVSGMAGGVSYSHTDSCSGNILTEWGCSGNSPTSQSKDCTTLGAGSTCSSGACVPPVPDIILPTLTINNPTGDSTYSINNATVNLGGTASDNIGVTSVTWTNARGGSGNAVGTSNWTVSNINLQSGDNLITVTAHDAASNTGSDTLTVTYTPPSGNYYCNADGDTYDIYFSSTPSGNCSPFPGCIPAGCRQAVGNDCNDSNPTVYPGAPDNNCNNIDNDCDGLKDEDYVAPPTSCGVGACARTGQLVCQSGTIVNTCTAGTPAAEICGNGIDEDCNGSDLTCPPPACIDNDGDGYGNPGNTLCSAGSAATDCNDSNPHINPGEANPCNCVGTPANEQGLLCADSIDNDCDGVTDCVDGGCAGSPGPGGVTCCQLVGNCLTKQCASVTCSSNICNYTAVPSLCLGNCDRCNSSFSCEADPAITCGPCADCLGGGTNYSCAIPTDDPNCSTKCTQCVLNGTNSSCQSITGFQSDNNGANQCHDAVGCAGGNCVCDDAGVCVSCLNADSDAFCDSNDACPYDPSNDFDGDGTCAVGCASGSSRTADNKTNGWICNGSSTVAYDTCQGSSCNSSNSCKVVFGAEDYFNIYINGKMVTGNLYLPRYTSYNRPIQVIDNVYFNATTEVNNYLVSGQNVIALEAYDTNPDIDPATLSPRVPASNYREVRGAFANYDDTGLCSLLPTPNRTYPVAGNPPDPLVHWPLKCYVIEGDNFNQKPSVDWNLATYNDTSWPNSVFGSSHGAPISTRIFLPKYIYNGYNPWATWGSGMVQNTKSHIFCRYQFTR